MTLELYVLDALAGMECIASIVVLAVSLLMCGEWRAPARPGIPAQIGTLLQKSPALIVTSILCAMTSAVKLRHSPNAVLVSMYSTHYAYRCVIYSCITNISASVSVARCALTFVYSIYSSFLQMRVLTQYIEYNANWLMGAQFSLGSSLWLAGLALAVYSDCALMRARKVGAVVVVGGPFDLVTMPQYTGEMLAWAGFAVACWSIQGLALALVVIATLAPRARRRHKQLADRYAEFPGSRAAVIPFLW